MRLLVAAVGLRQPRWADDAWDEFAKRLPAECRIELKAVKAEPRAGKNTAQCVQAEASRLESALPKGVRRVVLDERGTRWTTAQLAERMSIWMADGRDVAFLIGGPDGLDPALKASADETWRLSDLTLPHALARVLMVEALYRAWSLRSGHPYHRE